MNFKVAVAETPPQCRKKFARKREEPKGICGCSQAAHASDDFERLRLHLRTPIHGSRTRPVGWPEVREISGLDFARSLLLSVRLGDIPHPFELTQQTKMPTPHQRNHRAVSCSLNCRRSSPTARQ